MALNFRKIQRNLDTPYNRRKINGKGDIIDVSWRLNEWTKFLMGVLTSSWKN